MDFPFWVNGPEGAVYADDATAMLPVGSKVITPTGRVFRYVLVGAADLISGNANQSSVQLDSGNNDSLAITTSAVVGDNTLAITNGATTWTKNELKYGNLNLERNAELGIISYTIWSNTLEAAGSAAMTIGLWPGVTFDVALVAGTSVAGISPSAFSKVIITAASATAATGVFVGIAMSDVTLEQFGYVQSGGLGVAKIDTTGTPVIGEKLCSPATAAGCLDHSSLNVDFPTVAHWCSDKIDTLDFGLVYLTKDN